MDNETKNILKILGVAVVVLYLFKPRKKSKSNLEEKVEAPSVAKEDVSEKEYENAVIGIKAFRSAMNNNEPQSELDKLNTELIKDYGIKVFKCKKSGKLTARNSKGQDVAKEE